MAPPRSPPRRPGMRILVTGGAGFIGSAVVRHIIRDTDWTVANVDKLTYAAISNRWPRPAAATGTAISRSTSAIAARSTRCWPTRPEASCTWPPKATSTGRSTAPPPSSRPTSSAPIPCWRPSSPTGARSTRARGRLPFQHISTDEVFGSLGSTGRFTETTPTRPTRPIPPARRPRTISSAPGTTPTDCRPCHQLLEQLRPLSFSREADPLIIIRALRGESLPVYGKGEKRAGLASRRIMPRPSPWCCARASSETYNVGGDSERRNIDVVLGICRLLDEMVPDSPHRPHESLIGFVTDRPAMTHTLRHRREQDIERTGLAPPARLSRAACAIRCAGSWTIAPGGNG